MGKENVYKESKILLIATTVGFMINALSLSGTLLENNSLSQLLLFRIGDTAALMGCVTAGRYVANRGMHIGASAFSMLGIVHGISAGASSLSSINFESTANLIIPMVPAFILFIWCHIFPIWLRFSSAALAIPFALVFYRVLLGMEFFHWTLYLAYGSLATMELVWSVWLWKDLSHNLKEDA